MSQLHAHEIPSFSSINRAFVIGITLNLVFVIVEFVAGLYLNSLALISDAGHNLSDVASLALALVAFRLTRVKSSDTFTYGLRKSTILISLLNAIILLVVVAVIAWESIARFRSEPVVEGDAMAVVATIGIVINTITAMLFFKSRKSDLNLKGAFLHMAADALVSVGVVVTGLVIGYTAWYWLDTVVSLVIVVVIVISTWSLLRDSLILALDGVPRNVDMERVRQAILSVPDVMGVHHIHVWALSTTENALTAHIVVANDFPLSAFEPMKEMLRKNMEKCGVRHVTVEIEREVEACGD